MHGQLTGLNAAQAAEYLAGRRSTTVPGTLRSSLYDREGVVETDFQISRGLSAWAIERISPSQRRPVTAIVFGKSRSDALRRASAPARLGEEIGNEVTRAARITSGWDEPVDWPWEWS